MPAMRALRGLPRLPRIARLQQLRFHGHGESARPRPDAAGGLHPLAVEAYASPPPASSNAPSRYPAAAVEWILAKTRVEEHALVRHDASGGSGGAGGAGDGGSGDDAGSHRERYEAMCREVAEQWHLVASEDGRGLEWQPVSSSDGASSTAKAPMNPVANDIIDIGTGTGDFLRSVLANAKGGAADLEVSAAGGSAKQAGVEWGWPRVVEGGRGWSRVVEVVESGRGWSRVGYGGGAVNG